MKLNTDRIVSLSAMAVGIGSLFIIVYQTHLIRESQHASVLPYLMVAINSNDSGIHVTLSNAGIGPALIEDVRVLFQGRELEGDPHDFYISLRPGSDSALSINKIMPGRLIPAGASLNLLGFEGERAKGERGAKFLAELLHLFEVAEVARTWYAGVGAAGTDKAVLQITYASVYGDRWLLRSDRLIPQRLRR